MLVRLNHKLAIKVISLLNLRKRLMKIVGQLMVCSCNQLIAPQTNDVPTIVTVSNPIEKGII